MYVYGNIFYISRKTPIICFRQSIRNSCIFNKIALIHIRTGTVFLRVILASSENLASLDIHAFLLNLRNFPFIFTLARRRLTRGNGWRSRGDHSEIRRSLCIRHPATAAVF